MMTLVRIVGVIVFSLIAATMWATHKSIKRAECYRERSVAECSQPGGFERFIRWVNDWGEE